MNRKLVVGLVGIALTTLLLGVLAACRDEQGPVNSVLEVTSGREPNASVSGTVTYRERLALTPGAKLVMELRDVSLQDTSAPLIARQTISDPG